MAFHREKKYPSPFLSKNSPFLLISSKYYLKTSLVFKNAYQDILPKYAQTVVFFKLKVISCSKNHQQLNNMKYKENFTVCHVFT